MSESRKALASLESNPDSRVVIIFSTSEAIWGGSQIFNERLCHYLDGEFSAMLATASPELYSCETLGTPSVRNPIERFFVALGLAKWMRRLGSCAVILDDLSGVWLAPIFRFSGIKVLSILHLQLKRRDKFGFGHKWSTFHLIRFGSRFLHHGFTIGKDNVEVFPASLEFIGNAVAEDFFKKGENGTKKFDLGAVTRLSPEKNLTLLINLVRNLNAVATRPITCVIVGDGPEQHRLLKLTAQLGLEDLITFRPWVPRTYIGEVYDEIRCLAITSHHEGFATTLLESHARGVPCIVTDSSGFGPEFVALDGNLTGMVFNSTDVDDVCFLNSLLSMLDSAESYREQCISKAAKFSDEIVFGRITRRITEVMS